MCFKMLPPFSSTLFPRKISGRFSYLPSILQEKSLSLLAARGQHASFVMSALLEMPPSSKPRQCTSMCCDPGKVPAGGLGVAGIQPFKSKGKKTSHSHTQYVLLCLKVFVRLLKLRDLYLFLVI